MKWTLYKQYQKGRYLGGIKSSGERRHLKPIEVAGVILTSDPFQDPKKLLAWEGESLREELWHPVVSIQPEGIRVRGFERWRTVRGDMAAFQEWWLMPEVEVKP